MTKPKTKKKKKVSYETRIRRLKEQRASLTEEQRQKIKDYNRARLLRQRANETPMARELRLQRSRESARKRRCKRKAKIQKEKRKLGLLQPTKPPIPDPLDPKHPLLINYTAQMKNPGNNNLPSGFVNAKINPKDVKILGPKPPAKTSNNRLVPTKLPLPFINYKPAFPAHMNMPQSSLANDYDDMATVCPIECNVDISPEPLQKFKQPAKVMSGNDEIVKNIGAHVVLKKKVILRGPPEDVRLQPSGSASDWNGTASVCPIECNVDITDPEPMQHPSNSISSLSALKRNSLLDTLKQMGTHVIIKKKGESTDRTPSFRPTLNRNEVTRISPAEYNVDIKPVESRLKNSEITIVKHNGSNNIRRPGSQIMMQKVPKPVPVQQQRGYESPEEVYDDYDMSCPIECNVDISESS